jgi:chaperonin cofactor prefoldin
MNETVQKVDEASFQVFVPTVYDVNELQAQINSKKESIEVISKQKDSMIKRYDKQIENLNQELSGMLATIAKGKKVGVTPEV